jgi:hypothetical protein
MPSEEGKAIMNMLKAIDKQWDLRILLSKFIESGYEFVFFNELDSDKGQVVLRHDVDFDTHLALRTAQIEHEYGVKATYFFLLRSEFYNPMSHADHANILAIRDLGHKISLHYDPSVYDDIHEGLKIETHFFNTLFNENVDIVSLHRPNDLFLKFDEAINGIEHTYHSKYLKNVKYYSDSMGVWRFGYPCDTEEFTNKASMQVLTHPIWWTVEGDDNFAKLKRYFAERVQRLNDEFSLNCIPFREIRKEV